MDSTVAKMLFVISQKVSHFLTRTFWSYLSWILHFIDPFLLWNYMIRGHVFVPTNKITSKSNRSCKRCRKSSWCFLLPQALGSHWHFDCPWFRIRPKGGVTHFSLIAEFMPPLFTHFAQVGCLQEYHTMIVLNLHVHNLSVIVHSYKF